MDHEAEMLSVCPGTALNPRRREDAIEQNWDPEDAMSLTADHFDPNNLCLFELENVVIDLNNPLEYIIENWCALSYRYSVVRCQVHAL
jgi:hypothetical protein